MNSLTGNHYNVQQQDDDDDNTRHNINDSVRLDSETRQALPIFTFTFTFAFTLGNNPAKIRRIYESLNCDSS